MGRRDVRILTAAVFVSIVFFLACAGLGASSVPYGAIVVTGLLLPVAVAVVLSTRRQTYVPAVGRVLRRSPKVAPETPYAHCSLTLVVEGESFAPARARVWEPRVPAEKWPAVGTLVPVLVPVRDPAGMSVVWSEAPLTEPSDGGRLGDWYRRADKSQPSLRGRRIVESWPWAPPADFFETALHWLSAAVLGVQRRYCEWIAWDLLKAPEMLSLRTMTGMSVARVLRVTLAEQETIFDGTADVRGYAADVLGRALRVIVPAVLLLVPQLVVAWRIVTSAGGAAHRLHWAGAVAASGLSEPDLFTILACLTVFDIVLVGVTWKTVRAVVSAFADWHGELRDIVRARLQSAFRDAVNAPESAPLQLRTAPGLAGTAADQLLERGETARLRALAFDLGAGAIAVSGARGVGKTTLLYVLTGEGAAATEPDALTVLVSAPVQYSARDFLLHLYAQLCKVVLRRAGVEPRRSTAARLRAWARTTAAILMYAVAAGLMVTLFVPEPYRWVGQRVPLPSRPASLFLAAVALVVLATQIDQPRPARHLGIVPEAERRLQQTRFLQTLAVERSGTLGRSGLTLGRRRSRQLAEQPLSLPEIVEAYREFAREVAEWWRRLHGERGKVLIGVDEVDRIADPALAENFLNEIKAIFGVPHCVYLVAVSEEALANFERRVVRMRTVFDSAFDHVVRLKPLTLDESVRLLRLRLIGVPDRFFVLCHCLAGGMPREVLRTARTMFDLHRDSAGSTTLDEIAGRLIAAEVQSVKRGFLSQIAGAPLTEPAQRIADLLADPDWPEPSGRGLREAVERDLCTGPDGDPGLTFALAAAFLFYSTILELVATRPDVIDSWAAQVRLTESRNAAPPDPLDLEPAPSGPGDDSLTGLANALATLHGTLPINAPLAIRQLADIRGQVGLPKVELPSVPPPGLAPDEREHAGA